MTARPWVGGSMARPRWCSSHTCHHHHHHNHHYYHPGLHAAGPPPGLGHGLTLLVSLRSPPDVQTSAETKNIIVEVKNIFVEIRIRRYVKRSRPPPEVAASLEAVGGLVGDHLVEHVGDVAGAEPGVLHPDVRGVGGAVHGLYRHAVLSPHHELVLEKIRRVVRVSKHPRLGLNKVELHYSSTV